MKLSLGTRYKRLFVFSIATTLGSAALSACTEDSAPGDGDGDATGDGDGGEDGSASGGASPGGDTSLGGTEGPGGSSSGGDTGEGGNPEQEITVNTPASLTTESHDDYDDNEFGVISGDTLAHWIDDWEANRPEGISGRLVILQQDSKAGATAFIAHDDEHVFTYGFAEHAYADSQKRNNGLLDTFATIPDGQHTDEILNAFDIDLTKDLIVFAFADVHAVPSTTLDAGAKATKVWYNTRSWWWLRYWGASAEHLAILDGAASVVLNEGYIVDAPSDPPDEPGDFSVRELLVDNTSLKIDVGELIDLVHEDEQILLVDPRRSAEYTGTLWASPTNPVNGKRPVTEGRIKGARFLPWQTTLAGVSIGAAPGYATDVTAAVEEHGLRFKPKSELLALYDDEDHVNYDDAPEGTVTVHYCGHGRRASTWAFVSQAVLGVPARLYDGSWVEWGNLAGGEAEADHPDRPLPEDSKWRTDTEALSEYGAIGEVPTPGVRYNLESEELDGVLYEATAEGLEVDPDATHTDAIIEADRSYKLAE